MKQNLHPIVKFEKTDKFVDAESVVGHKGYLNTGLVYDIDTKIVYYKFMDKTFSDWSGYMSPYLGSHGRPCRFVDEKIMEISKNE